ncbi:MAG TPA: SPOR domain-containing protein [Blastocatellia bacterium]|nr:SPOR domain-containing protein [Blastocatellia bacterium]
MSNKQVVAIFIIGMSLLLGAFWAGLYVVKQDAAPPAANQNAQGVQSGKQAAANANSQAGDPQSNGDASYVVRVGSGFGTETEANRYMMEIRRKYPSAYIQGPTDKDTLYRIHIGPYKTREDANLVANELSSQGMKGVMIYPWPQK